MPSRKAPSEHAGPMRLGIVIKGIDGNSHIVSERSNGTHYWRKMSSEPVAAPAKRKRARSASASTKRASSKKRSSTPKKSKKPSSVKKPLLKRPPQREKLVSKRSKL